MTNVLQTKLLTETMYYYMARRRSQDIAHRPQSGKWHYQEAWRQIWTI